MAQGIHQCDSNMTSAIVSFPRVSHDFKASFRKNYHDFSSPKLLLLSKWQTLTGDKLSSRQEFFFHTGHLRRLYKRISNILLFSRKHHITSPILLSYHPTILPSYHPILSSFFLFLLSSLWSIVVTFVPQYRVRS